MFRDQEDNCNSNNDIYRNGHKDTLSDTDQMYL